MSMSLPERNETVQKGAIVTAAANLPVAEIPQLSLADNAYEQLRDKLIMLDIRPGEPINDGRVAAELQMGRTPVREALKRLENDHLVISYSRRGTFATTVDITQLADVSEIRELLEPLAASRAAKLSSAPTRERIREVAKAIASIGSTSVNQRELMRYDITAHRLIYRAAANPHLEDVLIRYDNLATRIWCLVLDKLPSVTEHITEHVELLEAIADADADSASKLAFEHVTHFEETIRHVL
jgi:DNA-binding GntR family transcriptional regulator